MGQCLLVHQYVYALVELLIESLNALALNTTRNGRASINVEFTVCHDKIRYSYIDSTYSLLEVCKKVC